MPLAEKFHKTSLCFFLVFFLSTTFSLVFAQFHIAYDAERAPNTYRALDNPNYWNNRKPVADYWQQDVLYKIDASINDDKDIIDGYQVVTYWNNSPDTLNSVYFHLYQNAFKPGSYLHQKLSKEGKEPLFSRYGIRGLGIEIDSVMLLSFDPDKPLRAGYEIDNTIMRIDLPGPVLPHETVQIKIRFKTYIAGSSMGQKLRVYELGKHKHFDGVNWYPRICVYDRVHGWNTTQYLGTELYGDYGAYDIKLTLPHDYIVEATGTLANSGEVMPKELRARLDLSNYVEREWGSNPTTVIQREESKTKTWHYYAENVHDFAFVADPTYRIEELDVNGVRCIAMVSEAHAAGWKNAASYAGEVLKTYQEQMGPYMYPKLVIADAKERLAFPMLGLLGGFDPNYRVSLTHEIAQMWFYGMLSTNATHRAALDEGFSQFLSTLALEKIDGKELVEPASRFRYYNKFKDEVKVREKLAYYPYQKDAMLFNDPPLDTQSSEFHYYGEDAYHHVYHKTAVMLYNLQYVLGDELFSQCMRTYFTKWRLCHPYFEDFVSTVNEVSGTDLSWFFDQWYYNLRHLDFKIDKVKSIGGGKYSVSIKRLGDMQAPLDISVVAKDGTISDYYIPNTEFLKQTAAEVLPKWEQTDSSETSYVAEVFAPSGVSNIIIDPSGRLPDLNQTNDRRRLKTDFRFDALMKNYPDRSSYRLRWTPIAWYNAYDGLKIGARLRGGYLNKIHNFDIRLWGNTRILNEYQLGAEWDEFKGMQDYFSYDLRYNTSLNDLVPDLTVSAEARWLDGLNLYRVGLGRSFGRDGILKLGYTSTYRKDYSDICYLHYGDFWKPGRWNNILALSYDDKFKIEGQAFEGSLTLAEHSLFSNYDFRRVSLSLRHELPAYRGSMLRSRLFAQFGSGSDMPLESALFLAGANQMAMMDSRFARSRGLIPGAWSQYEIHTNHFHHGGGLNMRGYAGYWATDDRNGNYHAVHMGKSGLSLNLEYEYWDALFPAQPTRFNRYFDFDAYVFADAGILNYETVEGDNRFAKLRLDSGLGFALTVKRFWILEDTNPFTVRMDFPLLLNRPPYDESGYLQYRWMLGIGRAF